MYQRINGSDWRNIWLMGDPHGCLVLLMGRLRQLRFDLWANLLIPVGNLIDRGPQSADCLGLLRCCQFRTVRGNHEQMALEALESGDVALWQMNSGDWYGRGTAQQRAGTGRLSARCQRPPSIIEVGRVDARHVIVYADYPAPVYCWQQPVGPQRVLWSCHRPSEYLVGHHGAIAGADHFWFGHTPLRMPYERDNQHYIDTGAVSGGTLTPVALQPAS